MRLTRVGAKSTTSEERPTGRCVDLANLRRRRAVDPNSCIPKSALSLALLFSHDLHADGSRDVYDYGPDGDGRMPGPVD